MVKEWTLGWQRCDGTLILSGALAGTQTPDLNAAGKFLRGALDSEAGQLQGKLRHLFLVLVLLHKKYLVENLFSPNYFEINCSIIYYQS